MVTWLVVSGAIAILAGLAMVIAADRWRPRRRAYLWSGFALAGIGAGLQFIASTWLQG